MRTGSLSILGAAVWDGERFAVRDLHIVDGTVADRHAGDAATVDGRGRWLIPGLIDAHFHAYATSMDGLEDERGPLSFAAINGTRRLRAALRRGFTAVRDVWRGTHEEENGAFEVGLMALACFPFAVWSLCKLIQM